MNSPSIARNSAALAASRVAEVAQNQPDAKHVLVIDEINRGNIAKVFGELYFPVVGDANALPGVRRLDVSVAARDRPTRFGAPRSSIWACLRQAPVRSARATLWCRSAGVSHPHGHSRGQPRRPPALSSAPPPHLPSRTMRRIGISRARAGSITTSQAAAVDLGGFTPQWWVPESWGPIFEPDVPGTVKGREVRVGLTRGRPLGYEFGEEEFNPWILGATL